MKKGFTFAESATHINLPQSIAKAGFTLAEVLITLGIIGVVAAMTIPNLMTAHKKRVIESKLKKAVSTINQAIKNYQKAKTEILKPGTKHYQKKNLSRNTFLHI